jgi:hypothetical protein
MSNVSIWNGWLNLGSSLYSEIIKAPWNALWLILLSPIQNKSTHNILKNQ